MNRQEIEEYEKRRLQKGPLEKYEYQDFGLVGNSTHCLYIHKPEWTQDGISPASIIDDFYSKELDIQIKLVGHYDLQKMVLSDLKQKVAESYGFSTWTQMCREQDRITVIVEYEKLMRKIVGGEYEHSKGQGYNRKGKS